MDPGKVMSGTRTTLDGVAVRVAVPPPEPEPLPFAPPRNGALPSRRLSVMNATMSRPTIDRAGAIHDPTGPMP